MSNIPHASDDHDHDQGRAGAPPEHGQGHDHGHGNHGPHPVDITVNEKPVHMADRDATGLMIKQAAVAQGVQIGVDFVLFHLLKNGQQRIVRDDEVIKLHQGEGFEAIRNDDNS